MTMVLFSIHFSIFIRIVHHGDCIFSCRDGIKHRSRYSLSLLNWDPRRFVSMLQVGWITEFAIPEGDTHFTFNVLDPIHADFKA